MPEGYQESSKNFSPYENSDLSPGTGVSCDPSATHCIQVQPDGESGGQCMQAHPLANTYAAALGFVESNLYGVGTRVLCLGRYGDSTTIIGSIPNVEPQGDKETSVLANKAIL